MTRGPADPDGLLDLLGAGGRPGGTIAPEELDELRSLWRALDSLRAPDPSEASVRRFHEFLEAQPRPSPRRGIAPWRFALPATLLAGLLGVAVGLYLRAPASPPPPEAGADARYRGWERAEATVRLQAVLRLSNPPGRVRDPRALLRLVRTDPDLNVRMAALRLLEGTPTDPAVDRAIGMVLLEQDSPLVQYAMIRCIGERRVRDAAGALQQLVDGRPLEPSVRDAAQRVLAGLR